MHITLFTIGIFDLFHYGHLKFLQNCRKISNQTIVALASDEHAFTITNRQPILSYSQRQKTLNLTKLVDYIYETTNDDDYARLLSSLKPSLLVVGNNYAESQLLSRLKTTKQWLDMEDITLLFNSNDQYISTNQIRSKFQH